MELLKVFKANGLRIEYLTDELVLVYHPEHLDWGMTAYSLEELKQYDKAVIYIAG